MVNNVDEVRFVETRAESADEKGIRIATSIKGWIAMATAIISIGFSLGLWAAQSNTNSKQLSDLNTIVHTMPAPHRVADKEIVDLQFKNMVDKLDAINSNIMALRGELSSQQAELLRLYKLRGK